MTRPSLFHRSPTRERQRDPRELARLRRRQARAIASRAPGSPAAAIEAQIEAEPADGDAGRARAAGGPVDLATYSCGCGLIFSAPVSTTVACPHCGCEQAW
jgi:hypothetical protein